MKVPFIITSTKNKPPKKVAKEVMEAFEKFKRTKEEIEKKVPEGLSKCPRCGEYRGKAREKDLPLLAPDVGYQTKGGKGYIGASCLCDGIVCLNCGRKVHRPISNRYHPGDGQIWHFPWFHCYCRAHKHDGRKANKKELEKARRNRREGKKEN